MSLETWDINAAAQAISEEIIPRLYEAELPEEDLTGGINLLQQFNVIAADMIQKSPGLEMPGGHPIEWNEELARQALVLFAEGIYYALMRCHAMKIPAEVKQELLQTMALDVYNQGLQVVASTYGQENTPDFQFSHSQQVEFIQKGGESALIYYLNEYERQNGPIHAEEEPESYEDQAVYENPPETEAVDYEHGDEDPDEHEPAAKAPAPPPPPRKAPAPAVPAAPKVKSAGPHDKYAAVALLLSTLKPEKRKKIIANFNEQERELISYYSYPQHIEQNLDLNSVGKHLQHFKGLLQQGASSLKSGAFKNIETLTKSQPMEKLLSFVKDERPRVQQYLTLHYEPEDTLLPGEVVPNTPRQPHLADYLPPRVEEILFRHLSQRVAATDGSSRTA